MSDFGVAVVGAGFIGPVHVEAIRRAGRTVVGILGVDEAESKSAAKALGIPKAYTSYEDLLGDDAASVVHIAVPNRFHYALVKQALKAGKHVLCEKPLAMNSKETREMVALAAKAKTAAAVNYNNRFYPLSIEAREMVKRGKIGDIHSIRGCYVQDWLLYDTDYNWRVLADEGGELRAVADIGTHWLDLIHSITGLEIEAVCADLATLLPVRKRPKGEVETFTGKKKKKQKTEPIQITTDDYGSILIRFKGGARGCLTVSQMVAGRKNRLFYEIAGSKRALAWSNETPNELWIGHRDEANELLLRDPALVCDETRKAIAFPGGHNEGFPDSFKQLFRAFYNYIDAGNLKAKPPYPTFADGHREVVLCEAIAKSN
ncbi:MAG: Gfo/Idh/MocA family oxidoreductase, partial [Planctomycetes bacterium]|nr:Gfo/Idh/MocA family oxidoreductase [Planctomycetota bacterium]